MLLEKKEEGRRKQGHCHDLSSVFVMISKLLSGEFTPKINFLTKQSMIGSLGIYSTYGRAGPRASKVFVSST